MFQTMIHIKRQISTIETAAWSVLQGSPKDAHGPKGVGMNIYREVLYDDIFDRKCNELMEQLFELKLQSENTLNKFKRMSQNPFQKPMLNSRMIVTMIMGMYNRIIMHDSYNGIPCIYSYPKQYSSTRIMYLGSYIQYVCKCFRKFNISYPKIHIHVCTYRARRRGWELGNVIFQEILCTYYKESPSVKVIFTLII